MRPAKRWGCGDDEPSTSPQRLHWQGEARRRALGAVCGLATAAAGRADRDVVSLRALPGLARGARDGAEGDRSAAGGGAQDVNTLRTIVVRCRCNDWLADVLVTGEQQRLRVRQCKRCKLRPVVFVDKDGRYCVAYWPSEVELEALPWPKGGWR